MTSEISKKQIKSLEERLIRLEREAAQWIHYKKNIDALIKQLSDRQGNIQAIYDYMSEVSKKLKEKNSLAYMTLNRLDDEDS